MHKIVVLGKPRGKDRPRFDSRSRRAYTSKNTALYERMIAKSWRETYGQEKVQGYIYLSVFAYFPLNKTDSLKTKEKKLNNELKPNKKPDADNILKVVADALNGVAYDDDKQITVMYCRKLYAKEPRIEVFIDNDVEVDNEKLYD